jgi:hypothetical protein
MLFVQKDYTGLGRFESGSNTALNKLRDTVLNAVPASLSLNELMDFFIHLEIVFRDTLAEINVDIGLKSIEVDFAAGGFRDVCQTYVYSVIRSRMNDEPLVGFVKIYQDWINSTVRITHTTYPYHHENQQWTIQILSTVYGRMGLIIHTPEGTHYIRDTSFTCPAENFMYNLLTTVIERVQVALG